jgi:hypothetical protein
MRGESTMTSISLRKLQGPRLSIETSHAIFEKRRRKVVSSEGENQKVLN